MRLSAYDQSAADEICEWENPPRSWRTRVADEIEGIVATLEQLLPTESVEVAMEYLVPKLNAASTWSAPTSAILIRFRRKGFNVVKSPAGIQDLSLQDVDRVATKRRIRQFVSGATEGGATGWAGAPGIPVDIVALMGLSLREINVYAAFYGFDRSTAEERAFVLKVLNASTAVGQNAKRAAIASLPEVLGKLGGAEAAKMALERLPEQLLMRTAAMKSANVVPLAGAVVGASFNQWYLRRVGRTAYFAYRKRFLERDYGEAALQC